MPSTTRRQKVTELVIADLRVRTELGTVKYGEPLQTFNGRNALQDLYEELLDAAQYVKQRLLEDEAVLQGLDDIVRLQ